MRFPKRLARFFALASRPEAGTGPLRKGEVVTRLCFTKIVESEGMLRAAAADFAPDHDLRVSVFRIAALENEAIWSLLAEQVEARRPGRHAKGRADLPVDAIEGIGLHVVPKPAPHPRHAELEGWPTTKQDQQYLQQRLSELAASRRSVHRKPEPDNTRP